MTLLLALSCDSFVMQASDRRLSVARKPLTGEWNKAVVWCNMASIAFTGNAYRDHRNVKPVDDWITEIVGGARSVHDLYASLLNGATDWLESRRVPHPQAFSLVGWAPQLDGTHLGYVGLISNFHDKRGTLRAPTKEFTWLRAMRNRTARPRSFFLARAGALMRPEEFRAAMRGLKRVMKAGGDPARAADILTGVIRLVAERDPTVGREVMITCLPRPSGTGNEQFLVTSRAGRPSLSQPSFFYRGTGDDSVSFAPQTVCQHAVQTIERIRYLNASGGDVDMLMSVRLLPSHPMYQANQKKK
ncbi:hypothetical protein O7627_07140 [Solwaraspora sp. WMMD1047]|uniref:hypothetical protein n=1 Tax=Solwaraspora sp. WMMD1047 TaxID=3016102 RepID=UPI002416D247|nr:hypothetical protein [Solwaraspora sp. WMMD1047]MDG4829079.1 hypothetical protein [Solwaraspora sp. WMMD1047]